MSETIGFETTLKINIADVTASQLMMIFDHVKCANEIGWKPDWLGSEIGHVWKEEDAWLVLQEDTIVTLSSGKGAFDMGSFLRYVGVADDKIKKG